MQELIPYLEEHYRVIREAVRPGADRWIDGRLGVDRPAGVASRFLRRDVDVLSGSVDFRHYEQVNVYKDTNAFIIQRNAWITQDRPSERLSNGQPVVLLRQENQLNNARGSHRRGGENFAIWEAVFGPVDKDGYPAPIWNDHTGAINADVGQAWRPSTFRDLS